MLFVAVSDDGVLVLIVLRLMPSGVLHMMCDYRV